VGLDVLFHESNGTLTSGSEVLKPKFVERGGQSRALSSRSVKGRRGISQLQWAFVPNQETFIGLAGSLAALRRLGMTNEQCGLNSESHLRLSSDHARRLSGMSDHVYKKLELVGSSTTGIEDAVQNALSLAAKTIRNMRWFEVVETRGHIEENKINHWQVTVKVGFTLDR
jgi:dodecin